MLNSQANASGDTSETEGPRSRNRNEDKWKSSVFDGPIVEQSKRKKLGGKGTGAENLFGQEKIDYENKSNQMVIIGSKKKAAVKKWQPVRKTAEQRKHEELYGQSARKFGVGKRADGTLMAHGTDWRSGNQAFSNSPVKRRPNENCDLTPKGKKHQNLQSNILCNQDSNTPIAVYNPEVSKQAADSEA